MCPVRFQKITSLALAMAFVLGVAWQGQAQDQQPSYPSMAPLDQYLMADRNGEIALARSALPMPELGAMSYMMAKDGYLGDSVGHWYPHLMLHIPKTDGASWGANLPGSPVLLNDEFRDVPEPETIFMVPVGHWSDGTTALNGTP